MYAVSSGELPKTWRRVSGRVGLALALALTLTLTPTPTLALALALTLALDFLQEL